MLSEQNGLKKEKSKRRKTSNNPWTLVKTPEVCDQNSDGLSRNHKSCHICSKSLKGVLAKCENMGLCLQITCSAPLTQQDRQLI